jgi:hypothetical protein
VKRIRTVLHGDACNFAANVLPIIRKVQADGHTSYNVIGEQLNARKASANGDVAA